MELVEEFTISTEGNSESEEDSSSSDDSDETLPAPLSSVLGGETVNLLCW